MVLYCLMHIHQLHSISVYRTTDIGGSQNKRKISWVFLKWHNLLQLTFGEQSATLQAVAGRTLASSVGDAVLILVGRARGVVILHCKWWENEYKIYLLCYREENRSSFYFKVYWSFLSFEIYVLPIVLYFNPCPPPPIASSFKRKFSLVKPHHQPPHSHPLKLVIKFCKSVIEKRSPNSWFDKSHPYLTFRSLILNHLRPAHPHSPSLSLRYWSLIHCFVVLTLIHFTLNVFSIFLLLFITEGW